MSLDKFTPETNTIDKFLPQSLSGGRKKGKPGKKDAIKPVQDRQQLESVQQITEDDPAAAGQREKRKRLLSGGRKSNVLSGIQTQLKKRLGE